MGVMTAIGLTMGVASMGFGLYNQMEGQDKAQQGYALQQHAAQIQAQAAKVQAEISKTEAASSVAFATRELGLNRLASEQSTDFSARAREINSRITGFESNIEGMREKAMNLDARRRQMEIIRNQQRYRALALTNATAQGAQFGSGIQGGYGQISGQTGVNLLGVQQNLGIGQDIFALNRQITGQKQDYANLQYNYGVQQAANQSTKAGIMYDYALANAAFQTQKADAGTMMSQGQGFANQGQGIVNQGNMQSGFGSALFNAGPQLFNMGMNASNVLPTASSMFGNTPSTSLYTTPASYANSAFGNYGLY